MNPTQTRSILLVDDDKRMLSLLEQVLLGAGYTVYSASSAAQTHAMLSDGIKPCLAIVDIHLPLEDGFLLAASLQTQYQIPFLLLTADSLEASVQKAAELGALTYLVKPVSIAQLLPAVESGLAVARELHKLRLTTEQLQTALNAERDIHVSVGITMMQYRVSKGQAYELLRKSARSQRRKLAELAPEIIQASETLNLVDKD